MAHGKDQNVTIQYSDGTWQKFEDVHAVIVDDGMVQIFLADKELPNSNLLHRSEMVPLHRVNKLIRETICTRAEHKANEAKASAWDDFANGRLRMVTGFAAEDNGDGERNWTDGN